MKHVTPITSESWLPAPDYTGIYEVSNHGRIRSLNRTIQTVRGPRRIKGCIRSLDWHTDGYPSVKLSKNGKRTRKTVHGLVARAFHGLPPGPIGMAKGEWSVDHINGDKTNNHVSNLRWTQHNRKLAFENGLIKSGEAQGNAKLTEDDVRDIRRRYTGRWGQQTALAKEFDVSKSCIRDTIKRKTWRHVK